MICCLKTEGMLYHEKRPLVFDMRRLSRRMLFESQRLESSTRWLPESSYPTSITSRNDSHFRHHSAQCCTKCMQANERLACRNRGAILTWQLHTRDNDPVSWRLYPIEGVARLSRLKIDYQFLAVMSLQFWGNRTGNRDHHVIMKAWHERHAMQSPRKWESRERKWSLRLDFGNNSELVLSLLTKSNLKGRQGFIFCLSCQVLGCCPLFYCSIVVLYYFLY